MDWICLYKAFHTCAIRLISEEFGGQDQHLEPFMNNICSVTGCIILLKEDTAIREYHWHEGMYLVYNNV